MVIKKLLADDWCMPFSSDTVCFFLIVVSCGKMAPTNRSQVNSFSPNRHATEKFRCYIIVYRRLFTKPVFISGPRHNWGHSIEKRPHQLDYVIRLCSLMQQGYIKCILFSSYKKHISPQAKFVRHYRRVFLLVPFLLNYKFSYCFS